MVRGRYRLRWCIERPYIHGPWPDRLPTFRDWLLLLFGMAVMAFAFKQYINLGIEAGWYVAVRALLAEVWRETKEAWHG